MQPTSHIAIDADTCSGHPRVAGTRLRVANIVLWMEQGKSPDEIASAYPQLTLAGIHAAMAFYFDNQAELDRMIGEDATYVTDSMARSTSARSAG